MAESARKSAPIHAQLAEVRWRLPSIPPDTSGVDDAWVDDAAPRQSFVSLKSLPTPRPGRREADSVRPVPRITPKAPTCSELLYDVWEGPTAWLVLVDLPGVDEDRVSLSLGSHALYLEVEVPAGEPRPGVASGHYSLSVDVPSGLAADAIDASLAHGLLRVRITTGGLRPRRVPIRSAD